MTFRVETLPAGMQKWVLLRPRLFVSQTRGSVVLFVLIVFLFIALRFWRLTTYGLWFDEAFSHQAAQLGWGAMIDYVVADIVHPPLFYALLKVWIGIGGESLLWLKLFPVLTSIATLVPFVLLCREFRLSASETNSTLFLVAVNAFLIYYAQELRMYALLVFFSLWSFWLFVRLANDKEPGKGILVSLFIVNLLVVYTQYLGWLVVGIEGLYLLIKRRQQFPPFLATVAAVGLCYVPWAYIIFRASVLEGRGLGELVAVLASPRLRDVVWYMATLNGPFYWRRTTMAGLILFGFPLTLWGWRILRRRGKSPATFWMLFCFSFLFLGFAFIASYLLRPVWTERYLIITAIPYLAMVTIAVHQLKPNWLKTVVLVLVTGWAAASGVHILSRGNQRFAWFTLVRHMVQSDPGAAIKVYVFERHIATPLESSLRFLGDDRFQILRIRKMEEMQGTHFWIAFRDTTWEVESPQTFVKARGCQVGREFSVSNRMGTNPYEGEAVIAFPVTCP